MMIRTKTAKRKVCLAIASAIALSTVAPSVSLAQERQELPKSTQLKGIGDDARMILDTEAAIIQAVSGVDITKDIPLLSSLFPKKTEIDYERISRDVARVVKEAFVENNLFDQKARTAATVQGLKRYVTTEQKNDAYLVDRLDHLDEIMARVSQKDLRLAAAGYYASAAQIALGVMSLRIANSPTQVGLKNDAWNSLREYRQAIELPRQELRNAEETKVGEHISACGLFPPDKEYSFYDRELKVLKFSPTMNACQLERSKYISGVADGTVYLSALQESWNKSEIALLGGEEGLKSYEALANPETYKKLNLPAATAVMRHNLFGMTEPAYYNKSIHTVCNAIGTTILKAQYEGGFPNGNQPREDLLRAVNCPASSGPQ